MLRTLRCRLLCGAFVIRAEPAAFLSYVHADDEHEGGQISQFRERLRGEVRMQTGENFPIFQDRNDIAWGQNWQSRIDEALDTVTLLIPVMTPSFFTSKPCRDEVTRFLAREHQLGRNDLILPIYYVSTPQLDDPAQREADALATELFSRQYADWRELRFEPFTAPVVRRALVQLAVQIRKTFEQESIREDRREQEGIGKPTISATEIPQDIVERAPAAKSIPPTHVVDTLRPGNFLTLTAAIESAQPGDRILVRPGLYRENIVLDKPLEIIGQGSVEDIVIQAGDADVLLFKTNIGRVTNLTLQQLGGSGGKKLWYGVNIEQGRLELEGCNISSQSGACVAIHGGADPHLRRNLIHDGKQSGVHVYNGGLGTLEDNDITGNSYTGVMITRQGNPTLRRNRIHDGKESGTHIDGTGLGLLEDNDISGNGYAGVMVTNGGNPTLRRNQIHGGKQGGVHVHDNGLGLFEDNDIYGNNYPGVTISKGGNPTFRRNLIRDNKQSGAHVDDHGLGTLEENDITGNSYAGVTIAHGGNPTLLRNRIRDGKQGGVHIFEQGLGLLEGNDIAGNTYSGVTITNKANPTLRRNQIHDGKQGGVNIHDNGLGILEDNDISGNAFAGVVISDGGNPTLQRNRINRNGLSALWIRRGGRGTIEDNDLSDNTGGAWSVEPGYEENVYRVRNKEG